MRTDILRTQRTGVNSRISLPAALAIVAAVAYAFLINFDTLSSPPAWDSATTVSPAALTIVERDFDIWEVALLPGTLQGGPSTHVFSLYTIALAGLISLFGPSGGFFAAHVLSILLAGALAGATYLLARLRLSPWGSALVAVAASFLPLVLQQTADVYMDLPLAVVATLACWSAVRRRFFATAALVFLGAALKTSGVLLIPLLLLARPIGRTWSAHLIRAGIAAGIASIPFGLAFVNTDRFMVRPGLDSHIVLLGSAISLFAITVDLLVVMTTFLMVTYSRARTGSLDRVSKAGLLLLAGFFAVHVGTILISGTITILPRYYVIVLPTVLTAIPPVGFSGGPEITARNRAAAAFLGILLLFSVANYRGDFYPVRDHIFYVAAERSTRAQDLLDLQVQGTRRLVEKGLPIVVGIQEHFRTSYPGMGYVDEKPDDVFAIITRYPTEDELADRFALLLEPRAQNPLITLHDALLESGYTATYEDLRVGPYQSRIAVMSKPEA